ncbi:germination protein YpeB [Fredinandcohnia quinoae]|uniref:Germination protein YpeB n=1 Tax=Fredinandcohnia quinoae TaxID=2918902 RepID=A0AAW5E1Y9_9BACI|nr:germination protein YpeB [Fredinandcohnia sp. SECRCQ15]MCH1624769.1 germination protein YpeB [Fredinandcohnia sp. SECRCQ15]
MVRGILITILTIGIIGTGYWGYKEHQEKNAVLIQAENNYQRAFHDLTYQVDLLHDKIGTTLAMNSRNSLSPALAEVWRITSAAHSDVGQLPLALLPFNKTEEFLSDIGDFSYRTAVRDLSKEPLSEEEYKTLKQLYTNAEDIQKELRTVQHLVMKNNLRWMDVELALASGEKQADNTIIDGLKTVEKNVAAYAESDFGATFTSMKKNNGKFTNIKGETIDKEKAKEIARKFLRLKSNVEISVVENGKGSENDFYSLTINEPDTKIDTYMDITKKGGYPIWVLRNRDVKNGKLSLNEASNNASKFLKENKFENQELFESAQYDNIGVFNFVRSIDGVRVYPDSIKMKVALDDGNIIGFTARDYLMAKENYSIPKPKITKTEAEKQLNQNLDIMEDRLAIVTNELNEDVLCYEFLGTIENDTYRIFINAENGFEEKVEKLKNAERVYDGM